MVDWEAASRQSDLRLWRAMFWIHIVLLVLGIVSLLLVIFGSEGNPDPWALVPGIAIVVMVAILLPNSYKKWQSNR
jgi:peptidoglycan/LPS O-acetylase OafA/YrhL